MSIARTQKREKAPAIKLFNKLFFDFIQFMDKNSEVKEGLLYVDPIVWEYLQEKDDQWRAFCNKILFNPKKKVKYKLDYLINEVNKHVDRLKLSALNKYINKFMNTIEIPEINFLKEIPSEIQEMNEDQFVHFAGELAKVFVNEMTIDDFKTSMVFKFLDVKHNRKKYAKIEENAKANICENVFQISELLDYFFIIKDEKAQINFSWTKNFIRKIGFWNYGPENALTDISFREYKDSNTYFREFSEIKVEESLNKLVAVLYRPRIFNWKFKYNGGWFFKRRARRMAKVPFAKRFGVFLFFSACEEYLHNGTFIADGQEISLKLLYEQTVKEKQLNKKQKYEANTGLAGIAYSLAKTGIFGPIEKVFNQNLYDVLFLLYQQRIEYLNQLENIKTK